MRILLLAVVFAFQVVQAPEHTEPPPGWFCLPAAANVPADHACGCHRIDTDPICEGIPIEESICKSWCFAQHCHCPVMCDVQRPK